MACRIQLLFFGDDRWRMPIKMRITSAHAPAYFTVVSAGRLYIQSWSTNMYRSWLTRDTKCWHTTRHQRLLFVAMWLFWLSRNERRRCGVGIDHQSWASASSSFCSLLSSIKLWRFSGLLLVNDCSSRVNNFLNSNMAMIAAVVVSACQKLQSGVKSG